MYRLCRRSNLIPFILVLAFGIGASILVPQSFPQTIGDIPMFALFPGEIAIALILSVLLFENASPGDLIKIAGVMLGIALGAGAIGNIVTQATVMMPESTLKLNWVQMLAFNLTGIISVMAYYTNTTDDSMIYGQRKESAAAKEPSAHSQTIHPSPHKKIDSGIHVEVAPSGENSKEILESLDVERINQLEQSINHQPGKVSLESLFAEETQAASHIDDIAKTDENKISAAPLPENTTTETTDEGHGNKLFEDVSNDIDKLFADIEPPGIQNDFSPPGTVGREADGPESTAAGSESAHKLQDAKSIAETAVKEFGRLSATASSNPNTDTSGTIKSIGSMLLDTVAVERIIKQADKNPASNSWQVLSVDNGKDLQLLMDRLAAFEGIGSALVIGKDGMLLSHTESLSSLKYIYGPISLAIHGTTNLGASKLQMGDLRQTILKSGDELTILTDFGSGLLAVFGSWNPSTLDQLLDFINTATSNLDSPGPDNPPAGCDTAQKEAAAEAPLQPAAPQPSAALDKESPFDPNSKPASTGGLLDISENELTDLIDGLLLDDSPERNCHVINNESKSPEPQAAEKPVFDASSLMSVDDSELSGLFDNLLSDDSKEKEPAESAPQANTDGCTTSLTEPHAEPQPVIPEAAEKNAPPEKASSEIKEFGKLSASAAFKPDAGQEQGTMKAIGRQLIDVHAVENIIKAGEKRSKLGSGITTARVISAARGEGIQTLLQKIDTYDGVAGSLIVGHDGLIIASTLKTGIDKEMMGAMCNAIHSHLDVATKKLSMGKLSQAIFKGDGDQLTVLTSVAVGILAVFVDHSQVDKTNGLLAAIETTIHG